MKVINKWRFIVIGFVFGIFVFGTIPSFVQEETYASDPQIELEVISLLNTYRIRDGRVPLARNADLDYLAQEQAEYMSQWLPLTDEELDYHADYFGDGIIRRAELLGWQGYGFPGQMYVSEIAAYFPSVQGMMDFWNNSPEHRRSVYEFGYREVGVAVIRNRNWYLTYVVFGGRPNVLPVLYHSARDTLFLTHDQSPFDGRFVPARVQILNEEGERLHGDQWLLWQPQMHLPLEAGERISVVYSDGTHELRTDVTLADALVFPDQPLTERPTFARTSAFSASAAVSLATPTMVPTPMANNSHYDVQIVYDGLSLSIINQSGRALDFDPFSIYVQSRGGSLYSEWLGLYSEVPLSRLPDSFCLQIWSTEQQFSPPPLPNGCRLMASGRSYIHLGDRFWLSGSFEVRYRERTLASCYADLGICEFDLPEN